MSTKKTPTEWNVDEVYESPISVIVQLTPSNYPGSSAPWPKVGDTLVVKKED